MPIDDSSNTVDNRALDGYATPWIDASRATKEVVEPSKDDEEGLGAPKRIDAAMKAPELSHPFWQSTQHDQPLPPDVIQHIIYFFIEMHNSEAAPHGPDWSRAPSAPPIALCCKATYRDTYSVAKSFFVNQYGLPDDAVQGHPLGYLVRAMVLVLLSAKSTRVAPPLVDRYVSKAIRLGNKLAVTALCCHGWDFVSEAQTIVTPQLVCDMVRNGCVGSIAACKELTGELPQDFLPERSRSQMWRDAICDWKLDVVCALLELGVSPQTIDEQTDINGKNALHEACHKGYTELASRLIEAGANIHVQDKSYYRRNALYYACRAGHAEITSQLIEAGANIHVKDKYGQTPLHWACEKGPAHAQIIQQLIEAGANVDAQGYWGRTALYWACHEGDAEIASLLVAAGANIHVKDEYGQTALDIAC